MRFEPSSLQEYMQARTADWSPTMAQKAHILMQKSLISTFRLFLTLSLLDGSFCSDRSFFDSCLSLLGFTKLDSIPCKDSLYGLST